ncbi:MAG: hypothetical protein JWN11_2022 [Hyphomicrobiales bacterium]|jgi:hypothetical protein|nr:hypothetical protein [Hyphomicrobiales bacterium]
MSKTSTLVYWVLIAMIAAILLALLVGPVMDFTVAPIVL